MEDQKLYIMNGDIPVGEMRGDFIYRINPDVEAPLSLFYNRDKVDLITFSKWYNNRVFPEERAGLEDLLKIYEVEDYNKSKILKKTKGRMIQDTYWVKRD